MTALAIAAVIVAALAFTDRVLQRRNAQVVSIDGKMAQLVADFDGRVQALEGLADRVRQLEAREAVVPELPPIPDYEALATKYNAIITNGINEMRELLAPLRKHILKAVPNK